MSSGQANPSPAPMVGADVMARQWQRYGDIVSTALRLDPVYTEEQCGACPYDHKCCDLMVSITPYEGLGIMSWAKANIPDWRGLFERIRMRADLMGDFCRDDSGKPRFASFNAAVEAWFRKGLKCVFYDHQGKRCSIYPVRPVNCRKAFGQGDCTDETANGIKPMREDPDLEATRASRVRVTQLEVFGQTGGEMCAVITMLRNPDVVLKAAPEDQRLLRMEPELLTDDQVLWGLGARPMDNPWQEDSHGAA